METTAVGRLETLTQKSLGLEVVEEVETIPRAQVEPTTHKLHGLEIVAEGVEPTVE